MNEVVLVGGSSRSPAVRAALRRALAKEGFSEYAAFSQSSPLSPSPSTPQFSASNEKDGDLSMSSLLDTITGQTPRNNDGTHGLVRSTHRTRATLASGSKVPTRIQIAFIFSICSFSAWFVDLIKGALQLFIFYVKQYPTVLVWHSLPNCIVRN